jgi:hypothetical protein
LISILGASLSHSSVLVAKLRFACTAVPVCRRGTKIATRWPGDVCFCRKFVLRCAVLRPLVWPLQGTQACLD